MKIKVCGPAGEQVIDLEGAVTFHEGQYMNRLTSQLGIDHYFLHDGTYDGYGMAICNWPSEPQP